MRQLLSIPLVVATLALASCSGEPGAQGPAGPQGANLFVHWRIGMTGTFA